MKPFSIVITSVNGWSCWYAKRIGETFAVTGIDLEENCIEVDVSHLGMNKSGRAWVYLDDCELAPQPEAAELALLRRVAEAAYDVYSMRSWEPNTIIAKQRELLQALKAWKAGTK